MYRNWLVVVWPKTAFLRFLSWSVRFPFFFFATEITLQCVVLLQESGMSRNNTNKKHSVDSMSFVFLTDLERIEALYRFRISCSDPRCRNIFILHSRKKKDNRRNVWTVRKKLEEKGRVKYSFVFAFWVKALTLMLPSCWLKTKALLNELCHKTVYKVSNCRNCHQSEWNFQV